jgi:hypothetical protein
MKITKLFAAFIATAFLTPLAVSAPASAFINDKIATFDDDFSIAIHPPTIEFDLTPGASSAETIRVRNTGQKEADLRIGIAPLSVSGEDYNKSLTLQTPRTEITRWTTLSVKDCTPYKTDDNGDLYVHFRVKEECNVTFTVKSPKNTPYGSQHMNIFFEEFNEKSGGGMKTIRSIGANVYATNKTGQNDSNGPCGKLKDQHIPFWVFEGPLNSSAVVENCGALDFRATVETEVTNLFGGTVYKDDAPIDRIVMAETTRRIPSPWKDTSIGLFKTKQTVKFLGETYEVEKWSFLIPVWLIMIILACILVIIIAIIHDHKKKQSGAKRSRR